MPATGGGPDIVSRGDAGTTPVALRPRAAVWILIAALTLLWFSAWNHPLHAPDEGRYGTVSAAMAESGEWVVPTFRGMPHLTKPPLIYWMQAAGIEVFGRSELAVRLPSLIAGSLTLLLVFWFSNRLRGLTFACVATALYSVMPEPLLFSRLGTTDATLNLVWFGALATGFLAIQSRSVPWLVAMWGCTAIAMLDKGPIGPAAVVMLCVWLALARRWKDLRWFLLHALWGAPLAIAPIGVWVWRVASTHPEAWQVWKEQFLGRFLSGSPPQPFLADGAGEAAVGAKDPVWAYVPVLLAGMFPATCMLVLPWFNVSWKTALRAFVAGDGRALFLIAVVGPLLFFSAAQGKMPAYIMPVAAPLALLAAGTLMRWLSPREDSSIRLPDVRITFLVVSIAISAGCVIAAGLLGGAAAVPWAIPSIALPLGAARMAATWRGGPGTRVIGLTMAWLSILTSLLWAFVVEDVVLDSMGARELVHRRSGPTAGGDAQFVLYGVRNPTIDFYAGSTPTMVWSVGDLRAAWPSLKRNHVILVPTKTWEWMKKEYPRLAESMTPLEEWNRWFMKPTTVLRMNQKPGNDAERSDSAISPEPRE